MAALQDLVDRVKQEGSKVLEKIQETVIYQNLYSKYYSLNPASQKIVIITSCILAVFMILSVPFSSFFSSTDTLAEFEKNRGLIQDLYRARQDAQIVLPFAAPPAVENLKTQLDVELKNKMLTAEQIKGVEVDQVPPDLPGDNFEGALRVQLSKLNVRQIIEIGSDLQKISSGLKMIDLLIEANPQEPKYFDVVYKLVALKVPQIALEPPPDEPAVKGGRPPPPAGKKSNSGKKKGDEP